jgi:hypothetical protein
VCEFDCEPEQHNGAKRQGVPDSKDGCLPTLNTWSFLGTSKLSGSLLDKASTAKFPLPECLCLSKKGKAKIFLSAVQIPLVSNDAATGHKLQGSSLDAVCIPSWSCSANWPCVVLSRVRTLDGLCLGKPLDPSKDHSVPQNLQRMLRKLRRNKAPAELDCDQLDLNRAQIDATQTTFGLDSNAEMHHRAAKQTGNCCVSINT